jgi:uncharacterized protein YutE (UPF0331/DUF86 family)
MMIETCLDVAGHIISDEGHRVPESYADMFKVLQENGIIKESLLDAFEKMARFRNIVVHHYDKIDPAIVVAILTKNLEDFNRFKNAMISYLKAQKNKK